jgi:SHS2 domain-containing protein
MHRFVDHTAELELELEAATKEGVLVEAAAALAELLGPQPAGTSSVRRRLRVTAADDATLLAAWLDELVFLAETEGFVPARVEEIAVENGDAQAVVSGRHGSPPHLVKGVTYNNLDLSRHGELWRGRVVLDV